MENEIEQLLADNTLKDIICSMPCDHPINVELERQLAQARREGWEQCQKTAIIKTMEHHQDFMFGSSIPTVCQDIAYTIAAMEYKGESK